MHFVALFTAFASATTVMGAVLPKNPPDKPTNALLQKNPADQAANALIQQLVQTPLTNPVKPPDKPFDTLNPWSGGVIPHPPPQGVFNYVSAKLTVPNPRPQQGAKPDDPFGVSAWVGINGFGTSTLLQVGIYVDVTGDKVLIRPFYQWLPQDPVSVFIENFAVRPGDVLILRAESSAGGSVGVVAIENQTTRQVYTKTLNANKDSVLSGKSVEWIVEEYNFFLVFYSVPPDASFTFTDTVAKASDGKVYGPSDGIVVNYAPHLLPHVDPGKVTVSYFPG